MNDWKFRVLFRLIMTMEGCHQLRQFSHVGVQIDPAEHSPEDVEWSRKCLKEYFRSDRSGGRGHADRAAQFFKLSGLALATGFENTEC